MKSSNNIILSNESVMEALEDYLNKHAKLSIKFEVLSWGIQRYDGYERIHVEFQQHQPPQDAKP